MRAQRRGYVAAAPKVLPRPARTAPNPTEQTRKDHDDHELFDRTTVADPNPRGLFTDGDSGAKAAVARVADEAPAQAAGWSVTPSPNFRTPLATCWRISVRRPTTGPSVPPGPPPMSRLAPTLSHPDGPRRRATSPIWPSPPADTPRTSRIVSTSAVSRCHRRPRPAVRAATPLDLPRALVAGFLVGRLVRTGAAVVVSDDGPNSRPDSIAPVRAPMDQIAPADVAEVRV